MFSKNPYKKQIDCEDPNEYRPGGFSPVIIGDILNGTGNWSYRIDDKVDFDKHWITWAVEAFREEDDTKSIIQNLSIQRADATAQCSERQKEVLRFLMSAKSSNLDPHSSVTLIDIPTDVFEFEGIAGKHLCIVTRPDKISFHNLLGNDGNDCVESVEGRKRAVVQLAKAVAWMHKKRHCSWSWFTYSLVGINAHGVFFTDKEPCPDEEFRTEWLHSLWLPYGRGKHKIRQRGGIPATSPFLPDYLVEKTSMRYDATDEEPNALLGGFSSAFFEGKASFDDENTAFDAPEVMCFTTSLRTNHSHVVNYPGGSSINSRYIAVRLLPKNLKNHGTQQP
ncbi:hypothetical protein BJ508DRAFT_306773 [Ascobolus immersus RN42]|uniref:Uncharacterized protein n=1 Tax=Ascobolus immersus RN42 TaxID=1160509 RepID=A0A3N4I5C4_ASCIM|nr:hypothetical protein BJ508DRAFT_306773 [Ascobolus immersus RN42]